MLRLHILSELGSISPRELRSETIQGFCGRLLVDGRHDNTGGLSAKTVHEIHAVVRNILDDAVRRGLLARNPTHLVATPRYRRDHHRGRKAWSAEELRAFLASLVDRRRHWWFALAACTGMRRGELVGLRWRDVDFHRHRLSVLRTVICVGTQLQVSPGKTDNAGRTIDLDPASVDLPARWRDYDADHFGGHDPNR